MKTEGNLHMRRLILFLTMVVLPSAGHAQTTATTPNGTQGVPAVGIYCINSAGAAVVCPFGGAVTQGAGSAGNPWYFAPSPLSATTTFSGQTNAIGTTSTAITINGAALSASNYKTVTLTNMTGCDVWLNLTGGPAVAKSGREVANNYQITFGFAVGYEMPTSGVTGIAVTAGLATPCTGGAVNLAVDAR